MKPPVRLPLGNGQAEIPLDSRFDWDLLAPASGEIEDGIALEDLPSWENELAASLPRDESAATARVVIVVPDATRPAPVGELVRFLVSALERMGVARSRMSVLVATGTHDSPSASILGTAWGIPSGVEVRVHDCDAPGVRFPDTAAGTPVELNLLYVEADLRITLGTTSFHYFAGFGGGPKMVFPGLASRAGALANHRLSLAAWPPGGLAGGCGPGRITGNPVAEDLAEAAGRCAPQESLHAVPVSNHWRVFPGEAGWEASRRAVSRRGAVGEAGIYDLVVASAGGAPRDVDLVQAHKGLVHAARYAKPGAPIVYLAAIPKGAGSSSFERWLEISDTPSLEARARSHYQLNAQTALSLRSLCQRHPVYWVGPEEPIWVERARAVVCRDATQALLAFRPDPAQGRPRAALLPSAAEIVPRDSRAGGATDVGSNVFS
jgi:nickel-dependent lactate racemase